MKEPWHHGHTCIVHAAGKLENFSFEWVLTEQLIPLCDVVRSLLCGGVAVHSQHFHFPVKWNSRTSDWNDVSWNV